MPLTNGPMALDQVHGFVSVHGGPGALHSGSATHALMRAATLALMQEGRRARWHQRGAGVLVPRQPEDGGAQVRRSLALHATARLG